MIYLVTRHPGTLEWLRCQVTEPAAHLEHLVRIDAVDHGDTVIGTLPINLVEAVCRRGARYLHLEIDLPQALRGQELSARQLTELGAELVEYFVFQPCADEPILQRARELEDRR